MTIRDSCRNGSYTARLPTLKLKAMLPYLKGQFRQSGTRFLQLKRFVGLSTIQCYGKSPGESSRNRWPTAG